MRRMIPARGEEHGSITVMFAVLFVVFAGAMAMSVDAGNYWQTRRNLITATDAAALATAHELAEGAVGCGTVPTTYLASNGPAGTALAQPCAPVPGAVARTGYVTIEATAPLSYTFGKFLGLDTATVSSTTTAQYGIPSTLTGLRPLALCIKDLGLAPWIVSPTPGTTAKIPFEGASLCGNPSGNWGWIDFTPTNAGNPELVDDVENGWEGEVAVGDVVEGNPGFRSSTVQALAGVEGQTFHIIVFQELPSCNGGNTTYKVAGFLGVKLLDVVNNGAGNAGNAGGPNACDPQPSPSPSPSPSPKPGKGGDKGKPGGDPVLPPVVPVNDGSYLEVEFVSLHGSGSCCTPAGGIDTGARVSNICAVDKGGANALNCLP